MDATKDREVLAMSERFEKLHQRGPPVNVSVDTGGRQPDYKCHTSK